MSIREKTKNEKELMFTLRNLNFILNDETQGTLTGLQLNVHFKYTISNLLGATSLQN